MATTSRRHVIAPPELHSGAGLTVGNLLPTAVAKSPTSITVEWNNCGMRCTRRHRAVLQCLNLLFLLLETSNATIWLRFVLSTRRHIHSYQNTMAYSNFNQSTE